MTRADKHRQAGTEKAPRTATINLERFKPINPLARRKVSELVERGAVVVSVRSSQVILRRGEQTAHVDDWGRVDWAH